MRIIVIPRKDSRGLDETRGKSLVPPSLVADTSNAIEFRGTLALLADDDGPDAAALHVTGSQGADTAQPTRTKVDNMSSSLGEGGCSRPVDRLDENLVAERPGEGLVGLAEIRA